MAKPTNLPSDLSATTPSEDPPAPDSAAVQPDDVAVAAAPAAASVARQPKIGVKVGPKGVFGNARIAWVVALLAVVAAAILGVDAVQLRAQESARAEVTARAELVALQVTTFTGAEIDDWVAQVQSLSTGRFSSDLTGLFDQQFRDLLREREVESVGEILNSFVQDVQGNQATAFVVARQTTRNNAAPQPFQDELRMEISLIRADGEWKADDVVVLRPGGLGAAPAPQQQPSPAPAG